MKFHRRKVNKKKEMVENLVGDDGYDDAVLNKMEVM